MRSALACGSRARKAIKPGHKVVINSHTASDIKNCVPWERVSESTRLTVSEAEWHSTVLFHNIYYSLPWSEAVYRATGCKKVDYYCELLLDSWERGLVYPYHLAADLIETQQMHPVRYYDEMIVAGREVDKTHDYCLSTLAATDVQRLSGIERIKFAAYKKGQIVDFMRKHRVSEDTVWTVQPTSLCGASKQRNALKAIDAMAYNFLTRVEGSFKLGAKTTLAANAGSVVSTLVQAFGFVIPDVTVEEHDVLIPRALPHYYFATRRSFSRMENLLYKICALANGKNTLKTIFNTLKVQMGVCVWAASLAVRLGMLAKAEPGLSRSPGSRPVSCGMRTLVERSIRLQAAVSDEDTSDPGAGEFARLHQRFSYLSEKFVAPATPPRRQSVKIALNLCDEDGSILITSQSRLEGELSMQQWQSTLEEIGRVCGEETDNFIRVLNHAVAEWEKAKKDTDADIRSRSASIGERNKAMETLYLAALSPEYMIRLSAILDVVRDLNRKAHLSLIHLRSIRDKGEDAADASFLVNHVVGEFDAVLSMSVPLRAEKDTVFCRSNRYTGYRSEAMCGAWFRAYVANAFPTPKMLLCPVGTRYEDLPRVFFNDVTTVELVTWDGMSIIVSLEHGPAHLQNKMREMKNVFAVCEVPSQYFHGVMEAVHIPTYQYVSYELIGECRTQTVAKSHKPAGAKKVKHDRKEDQSDSDSDSDGDGEDGHMTDIKLEHEKPENKEEEEEEKEEDERKKTIEPGSVKKTESKDGRWCDEQNAEEDGEESQSIEEEERAQKIKTSKKCSVLHRSVSRVTGHTCDYVRSKEILNEACHGFVESMINKRKWLTEVMSTAYFTRDENDNVLLVELLFGVPIFDPILAAGASSHFLEDVVRNRSDVYVATRKLCTLVLSFAALKMRSVQCGTTLSDSPERVMMWNKGREVPLV